MHHFLIILGAFFQLATSVQHARANQDDPIITNQDSKNVTLTQAQLMQWKNILFYRAGWFGSERSMVRDPTFYLSPKGRTHLLEELVATQKAVKEELKSAKQEIDNLAICRFPARVKFLSDLGLVPKEVTSIQCPAFHKFKEDSYGDTVTLHFASSDPSKPGSIFGHTFLRFRDSKSQASGYLDRVFNFGASPLSENPLTYAYKGLFGGHPGVFATMPLYLKIQEYVHSESRDIWEYDLDFSADQIERLYAILWEVGAVQFDYFYLDDNCAYVLLKTLEAANPDLMLTNHFSLWILPSDAVKKVWDSKGLVKNWRFVPSQYHIYDASFQRLNSKSKKVLSRILDDSFSRQNATKEMIRSVAFTNLDYASLSADEQISLLEAMIQFIDYRSKASGSEINPTYRAVRMASLSQRASFDFRSKFPEQAPPNNRGPHLVHGAQRLRLGTAFRSKTSGPNPGLKTPDVQLGYRAALNGHEDYPLGLSDILSVEVMRVEARVSFQEQSVFSERNKSEKRNHLSFHLDRIEALTVYSRRPVSFLETPLTWVLSAGYLSESSKQENSPFTERLRAEAKAGYTLELAKDNLHFSLLGFADLGFSGPQGQVFQESVFSTRFGAEATTRTDLNRFLIRLTTHFKYTVYSTQNDLVFDSHQVPFQRLNMGLQLSKMLDSNSEFYSGIASNEPGLLGGLSIYGGVSVYL